MLTCLQYSLCTSCVCECGGMVVGVSVCGGGCGGVFVHPPEHCPQQPLCEHVACFVCLCMLPTTTTTCVPLLLCHVCTSSLVAHNQCVPLLLCQVAWLLSAYTSDSWLPSGELQRCSRLLYLIRTEQIRAPPVARYVSSPCSQSSTASL